MSGHHAHYPDHVHKDTVGLLLFTALILGLLVGAVLLRPSTCAIDKSTNEHVCINDDPMTGPSVVYTPNTP